eukprot:CAMPEP_0115167674 /NCGR_PEP_ID=MMETSP0270-20121206/345_1 /TAXON_ID=71861 /ORGANISM="Scrippsiella trochoidea, Strain CCMP3099" /LENGTH=253 /DNA_ID=CAMNT_0002580289 /DNA_START=116 /DNA_END=878 /DNA_ORIENTATION=-
MPKPIHGGDSRLASIERQALHLKRLVNMVASGNRGFVMCYGFGLEHAANLDHTVSCHYRQGVRQELVARAFLRDGTAIVDVTLDLKVTIVDVILKNEVPTVASSVRQLTLRLKLSLLHAWHVSFMAAYRGSLLIEIGSLCDLPMSKSSSDVFGKAVELSGLRQSEREPDDKSCDGPDEDRWPEERPKSPAVCARFALRKLPVAACECCGLLSRACACSCWQAATFRSCTAFNFLWASFPAKIRGWLLAGGFGP